MAHLMAHFVKGEVFNNGTFLLKVRCLIMAIFVKGEVFNNGTFNGGGKYIFIIIYEPLCPN
jgi:hypothetical protein